MTPGPDPDVGVARYPLPVVPFVGKLIISLTVAPRVSRLGLSGDPEQTDEHNDGRDDNR